MEYNSITHYQHEQKQPNHEIHKKIHNLNLEKGFLGFMDERSPWINTMHTLVHDFVKIDGETFLNLNPQ